MPRPNEEIVFEDLRGVRDGDGDTQTIEVDLDADNQGIRRLEGKRPDPAARDKDDDDDGDTPARKARADADDGNEGDDADGDGFSRKFQGRLDRERRAKRRERERADSLEADNAKLRKQLSATAATTTKETKESLDRQVSAVEASLEAAIEKADTKQQVRLTSELTDLKARRIAADYGPAPVPGQDDEPGTSTSPSRNRLVDEWKDSHRDWYGRQGFERATRLANKIDREVHADGYEPSEEDYFEELDKRLRKAIPDVFVDTKARDRDDNADDESERSPRERKDKGRSPVAPAGDGSRTARQVASTGKVELNEDDFRNMRRFNLNPDDPAVLKEYAKNKRQIARGEG